MKADIVDDRLREFDYEAFMEAAGSRKSVDEIIRGNFEVQRVSGSCEVVRFDRGKTAKYFERDSSGS
ncbi:MAG TPA: hypothetical protein PLQ15_12070 [Syntrophales bacterium]|nr:hypothetical protein [Syntrophales bacterium]